MPSEYLEFLKTKSDAAIATAQITADVSDALLPFQKVCCERLIETGGGAAFLDTGLGKTIIQLEWARHMDGNVLIVAPLAVAYQTINEAKRLLGIDVTYSKDGTVSQKFTITNYERVENFDEGEFAAVVLDESSILKGQSSKTKAMLISKFRHVPYKLACTATPAPNDYTEIGNHAEFLGIMSQQEMLTRWFVHDSANTADWRLKKHAVRAFWEWVASWAVCVSKPSDCGFDDGDFNLPPLNMITHSVETETKTAFDRGLLFDIPETNASNLHRKKRDSVDDRVALVADMVNGSEEPWIVWCESNQESQMLAKAIPDAIEVKGSDSSDHKESALIGFTDGTHRVIVSKPSICGFGMNWQHCSHMVFASISYSYEQFYQAVRRCWRYGQTCPVFAHVVIADAEIPVWRAIEEKAGDHTAMKDHMRYAKFSASRAAGVKIDYNPNHDAELPSWFLTTVTKNDQ